MVNCTTSTQKLRRSHGKKLDSRKTKLIRSDRSRQRTIHTWLTLVVVCSTTRRSRTESVLFVVLSFCLHWWLAEVGNIHGPFQSQRLRMLSCLIGTTRLRITTFRILTCSLRMRIPQETCRETKTRWGNIAKLVQKLHKSSRISSRHVM